MGWLWRLVDWIGRFQTIQALGASAWVLLPVSTMIGTGAAGVLSHEPWMWIIFATSGAGAFITMAMFAGTLLSVWRNPQHKLKFVQSMLGWI